MENNENNVDNTSPAPSPTGELNKEELKAEATETVTQVKELVKNVDLKKEAENAKGFLEEVLKNPIGKMRDIAANSGNYLSIGIAILAVWVIATFLREIISLTRFSSWGFSLFIQRVYNIAAGTVSPIFIILVLVGAIYIIFKGRVKGFMPIVITMLIANAPRALGALLNLIIIVVPRASQIINPINSFFYIVAIVLMYFGIKALVSAQDDEKFFIDFIKVQALYFVGQVVLNFFNVFI